MFFLLVWISIDTCSVVIRKDSSIYGKFLIRCLNGQESNLQNWSISSRLFMKIQPKWVFELVAYLYSVGVSGIDISNDCQFLSLFIMEDQLYVLSLEALLIVLYLLMHKEDSLNLISFVWMTLKMKKMHFILWLSLDLSI